MQEKARIWKEKYNCSVLDSICSEKSICIVFEFIPSDIFLRKIEKALNNYNININDLTLLVNRELNTVCYRIDNLLLFVRDTKFELSPYCSYNELIRYLDVLNKAMDEIKLSQVKIEGRKLVSVDDGGIRSVVLEMMRLSETGSNIDGNDLSSQSRQKLEIALRRKYFTKIKSDVGLWLKICNLMNKQEYSIDVNDNKISIMPVISKEWGVRISVNNIMMVKDASGRKINYPELSKKSKNNIFTINDLSKEYENKYHVENDLDEFLDLKYVIFGKNNASLSNILRVCAKISDLDFKKHVSGKVTLSRDRYTSNGTAKSIQNILIKSLPSQYKKYLNGLIGDNRDGLSVMRKTRYIDRDLGKFHECNFNNFMNSVIARDASLSEFNLKNDDYCVGNMIMLKLCEKICERLADLASYMDNMGNAILSLKKDIGHDEIFIKDKKSDAMTSLSVPVAK